MSHQLSSFLKQLKQERTYSLPDETAPLDELLTRISPGRNYPIARKAWQQAKTQAQFPMLFVGHFCLYDTPTPGLPLFWWDPKVIRFPNQTTKVIHNYFVRALTEGEQDQLRVWVGALPPESEQVSFNESSTYGPYRLDEMKPGDMMILTDGTFCEVHPRQPRETNQIQVWLNAGTQRPQLALLERHVPVYGVSIAQARRIEQKRYQELDPGTDPRDPVPDAYAKDPEWILVTVEQLKLANEGSNPPKWNPDWLWTQLQETIAEGTLNQAAEWAQRLLDHLKHGGSPPLMESEELRTAQERARIAEETCQELLRRRNEARQKTQALHSQPDVREWES